MNRRRRLIIWLLIVLPILAFVVGAIIYIGLQVHNVAGRLDVILVEQIKRQTGRDATVGRVRTFPLGTATVYDLKIANGESFDSGTLLTAREVVIKYRWRDLISRRTAPIQSVESIRLIAPNILLERFRSGKLNIQDLLTPKPGPRRPPFVGVVDVENGSLEFRDWLSQSPGPKPVITRADALTGTFDASSAPAYVYDFTAHGRGGKLVGKLGFSGSMDSRKGVVSFDLRADNVAAAHWAGYFFRPASFQVLDGRADVRLSATRRIVGSRRVWHYIGAAALTDGRVSVAGFKQPAQNVRGTIRLADQIFDFNMTASMAGTPVSFTGAVVGIVKPKLDLHIASRSADYSRLLQAAKTSFASNRFTLIGRGPLDVNIVGPSDKLAFVIRGSIPAVVTSGYRVTDLAVRATYSGGVVEVERATGHALGGQVAAEGTIGLARGIVNLALSGTASGVRLADVPQLRSAGIQAAATGRFAVTGTSISPVVAASVQVSRGTFNNVPFRDAVARITITSSRITIHNLVASVASGVIRLAGGVSGSDLSLQVSATGVDLAKLLQPLKLPGYSGVADFSGAVVGPLSNPTVTGAAEIFNGRFQQYSFDYARGQIVATKNQVSLENAVVRIVPAEATFSGRIAGIGTKNLTVELQMSVSEAPAERILSLVNIQTKITGTLNGSLSVSGTAPNIKASGTLTLTDGTVEGYPVKEASATVAYANGELTLTDLDARSDGGRLLANGSVDAEGNLAFKFHASNVALAGLTELTKPYAVLSGTVDASGEVTGTTASPNLMVSIVSNRPTINTVQFDGFSASLAWNGTSLDVTDLKLSLGGGDLLIGRAVYDTERKVVAVEGGELKDFSFPALYTAVTESPFIDQSQAKGLRDLVARTRRPITGVLNASFSASGPVDSIEATAKLNAKGVDIADIKNAQLDLTVTAKQGSVFLDSFLAVAGPLNVRASGVIIANGRTDLEIETNNVDLAALAPATGQFPVTGTATVSASIAGPIESPSITASVEMENPQIYGIRFDRLRTGPIIVGRSSIDISEVRVTQDSHTATVSGTVPWDWSKLAVPPDQPIDLHAKMEDQDLGILAALTDVILTDKENPGRLSAALDVTGTLNNPNLSGGLTVVDGKIGIRNVQSSFTNLQASIEFSGDTARVIKFTGDSSAGGTFEVAPGGTISLRNVISPVPNQPRGMMDLIVRTDKLVIAEQNLFGYQEQVKGGFTTAAGGVSVTGPLGQPKMSGRITVADATVLLSGVPAAQKTEAQRYVFNPSFDLGFVLQDNVWFSNPNIKAQLLGDGRLAGTLARPEVAANLKIARGELLLPTQRMRITSGNITVTWTQSTTGEPQLPRIVVDLRAQTSVTATSPTGTRRRYNIVMTVQGPLDSLRPESIDLRSDPPGLSRTQMLAALGHFEDIYGGGELALRQQLSDIFTVAVSPILFGRLETAFIEALGLEEFNIEYGFEQPLSVFVSRKVYNNIYLSYWRIVTGATTITGETYSLRLSYRLRDWLDVGYRTDSSRAGYLDASYSRRF